MIFQYFSIYISWKMVLIRTQRIIFWYLLKYIFLNKSPLTRISRLLPFSTRIWRMLAVLARIWRLLFIWIGSHFFLIGFDIPLRNNVHRWRSVTIVDKKLLIFGNISGCYDGSNHSKSWMVDMSEFSVAFLETVIYFVTKSGSENGNIPVFFDHI